MTRSIVADRSSRTAASADPPFEAYVSFVRPVTMETAGTLLAACQTLMSEGVEHIHLAVGSGGGSIIAGLSVYNQLRALPLRFTTYNVGSVDSVAILPYLLGEERYADQWTSFLFHGVSWTFGSNGDTAHTQVADAYACVSSYERTLSAITASRTGIPEQRIREMRSNSTILSAEDARSMGLATRLGAFSIPRQGRWWQV